MKKEELVQAIQTLKNKRIKLKVEESRRARTFKLRGDNASLSNLEEIEDELDCNFTALCGFEKELKRLRAKERMGEGKTLDIKIEKDGDTYHLMSEMMKCSFTSKHPRIEIISIVNDWLELIEE